MKTVRALVLFALLIVLASCGPVPFNRLSGGFSDTNVIWKNGEAASRMVQRSINTPRGASIVTTEPELQALYDEWYTGIDLCPDKDFDGLGNLVTTITPTKFESSNWTVVSNPDLHYNLAFYNESVDFAAPNSQSDSIVTSKTFYDVLYIHFNPRNEEGIFSSGTVMLSNWVEIELPAQYESLWPADLNPRVGPVTGIHTADRQHLGGSKYQFALDMLIPVPSGSEKIDHIIYGPYEGVELFSSRGDPSFSSTSQLTGNPMYSSSAGNIILIPWDGVLVDANTRTLRFQVYLDINDIVEVYDNFTPADYSDDKVVLANRFWERFSIDVVQE